MKIFFSFELEELESMRFVLGAGKALRRSSSMLTAHTSLFTSPFTSKCSLLTAYFFLTPDSSVLTPHSSFLTFLVLLLPCYFLAVYCNSFLTFFLHSSLLASGYSVFTAFSLLTFYSSLYTAYCSLITFPSSFPFTPHFASPFFTESYATRFF